MTQKYLALNFLCSQEHIKNISEYFKTQIYANISNKHRLIQEFILGINNGDILCY